MRAPAAEQYLRPDVEVEPLVNGWYAWVHLVPPATAAINIAERHLRAMSSYVRSPGLHAAAAADPSTRSGPFIDLGGGRVDEVQDLLERTRLRVQRQLDFTAAVRHLDLLLRDEAVGGSLEELYARVPASLQGFVELHYDRRHQPGFRLYEPLLYASSLYDADFQSVRLSRTTSDTGRPFVFSTPRLPDDSALDLRVPIAAPGLDALFASRTSPVAPGTLIGALGVDLGADDQELFRSFFTCDPPRRPDPCPRAGLRIRYFGHACLLLETDAVRILVDPVVPYEHQSEVPRYSFADLPEAIDYVLITHAHHDHVVPETLVQLRHKVGTVVVPSNDPGQLQDPSLRLLLGALGFERVREIREMDVIDVGGGAITALPFVGEHHDLSLMSKVSYHVELSGRKVLVAADTCNVNPSAYRRVHDVVGDLDVIFLGMECDGAPASWVYGPYFSEPLAREHDEARRGRASNCAEAMELVRRFDAKEVYVYAMGEEPWLQHLLGVHYTDGSSPIVQSGLLVDGCRSDGRVAEHLFGRREMRWA